MSPVTSRLVFSVAGGLAMGVGWANGNLLLVFGGAFWLGYGLLAAFRRGSE